MWYPSQEQLQQQSWYKHVQYTPSQQLGQQTYARRAYYCNDEELSSAYVGGGHSENDSFHYRSRSCYPHNKHVAPPSDCNVLTSNNKFHPAQMSSDQTAAIQRPSWNPAVVAPSKTMRVLSPSPPAASCWNWLLFSPEHYSNLYQPATHFLSSPSDSFQRHAESQDFDWHSLACLPTCLLALLCLTPQFISISEPTSEENEPDREMSSLNYSKAFNSNDAQSTRNRSTTPDSDDGYQSASDASRSDCSQPPSIPSDDHPLNEHSLFNSLTPRCLSYAAAAKPILSSYPTPIGKPKQIFNSTFTSTLPTNDGQKFKFIAPRFERMHHAKQHASSSSSASSNRSQLRTNNPNPRHFTPNSTRRR